MMVEILDGLILFVMGLLLGWALSGMWPTRRRK